MSGGSRAGWGRRAAGAGVLAVLAGAASLTVWACGGSDDPVCGNGVPELGEECDDGNLDETDECRQCVSFRAPLTVITWAFNEDAAPGFDSDGCLDVGSFNVRVALTGPTPLSRDTVCSARQVTFSGLAAGTYQAAVTPLDSGGASLVAAPVTVSFDADPTPNSVTEHHVVVPPEAWVRTMTGTFFYLLRWAGEACADAAPPVVTQTVTVAAGGSPLTLQANVGSSSYPTYRVDGTEPVPCVTASAALAEAIQAAPFGRATVSVVGQDTGGATMFRGTFDTFIGAGPSNPTITFDVPSTIDAGIDAPIDAAVDAAVDADIDAPIDAGVDDAAPDA